MTLGRQDLLCSFFVLDRKHGGMTCCWKASMFTYQYAMCMQDKATEDTFCSVQHTTFCIHYRVGQKTGLFSWADNFATAIAVGRRVIRQKFPNFVFKKVSHLNVSEIKYICQVCINIQRMWNFAEFENNAWILPIFTARRYASEVYAVALCPSVSVTSRCSTKKAKRRIKQRKPHDSPGALGCQRSPQNLTGVTPYGDAKCRLGRLKSATFDK